MTNFDDLKRQAWQVIDDFFTDEECLSYVEELKKLERSSRLKKARIGKKEKKDLRLQVRQTQIYWIQNMSPTQVQKAFLDKMYGLLAELKRQTFIPLNTFETHYSIYPKGGFYQKHLDQFQGDTSRQISFILYLNPEWSEKDGGELVIYNENKPDRIDTQVLPRWGRLVIFLSGSIEHEVLVTNRKRYSLTGWMRQAEIQKDPLSIVR